MKLLGIAAALVLTPAAEATSLDAYLGRQVGLVESLRMLSARRLDGWFMADVVFRASLPEYDDQRGDFGGLVPVLELNSAFFVNRDSPLWPDRDRIAKALAEMSADGTNRRIVDACAAARR